MSAGFPLRLPIDIWDFLDESMGEHSIGALFDSSPKKTRSVGIQTLANGYTVSPEYSETLIANTLVEALELARKVLE
jgi:hypothetical protein